jgi:predicted HTH domain antitoxin
MDLFAKPIEQFVATDILRVIELELKEGTDLEFKGALATKDGSDDRWITTGDRIGDEAKRDLTKELVGFANASGGTLILGIEESEDKPPRARRVRPLPKVIELADRLKMACRDLAEPRIPHLSVVGVPTDSDGSGVVILRVEGRSLLGPHRHSRDKEFYIRRNDESMPMTVEEIRRYSIGLQQRSEAVQARLDNFARSFFASGQPVNPIVRMALCIIPTSEMHIPFIHRRAEAKLKLETIPLIIGRVRHDCSIAAYSYLSWRAIVRGTEGRSEDREGEHISIKLFENGEIYLDWQERCYSQFEFYDVYLEWVLGAFANGLLACQRLQRAARLAQAEYTAQFNLLLGRRRFVLQKYGQESSPRHLGEITSPREPFPALIFNTSDDLSELCTLFERDILNYVHVDYAEAPKWDFSGALNRIDQDFSTQI